MQAGAGGHCEFFVLLALSLLALPSCLPLPCPSSAGRPWGQPLDRLSSAAPRGEHGLVVLRGLRGGSMPGFGGPSMDFMDKIMTPDMIRGAANMMSNMDPGMLKSMMSMTGMPADDFDPEEAKRAAEKLKTMTTTEIAAMKDGALSAPFPGAQVGHHGLSESSIVFSRSPAHSL
jgi:hypothetical protein